MSVKKQIETRIMKAHPNLFLKAPIITIREFAGMEIPATRPNHSGVFTDCVNVGIPMPQGYAAVVCIAKDIAGKYHTSRVVATSTGAAVFMSSAKWNTFDNKEAAFLEGLEIIGRRAETKHFREYIRMAKVEYFNSSHRQLSLFENE